MIFEMEKTLIAGIFIFCYLFYSLKLFDSELYKHMSSLFYRYGRYNTCKRLLDSEMGPNIINETDGDGLSALHIAAQNGHTKIITLLMQRGAYVTK